MRETQVLRGCRKGSITHLYRHIANKWQEVPGLVNKIKQYCELLKCFGFWWSGHIKLVVFYLGRYHRPSYLFLFNTPRPRVMFTHFRVYVNIRYLNSTLCYVKKNVIMSPFWKKGILLFQTKVNKHTNQWIIYIPGFFLYIYPNI